MIARSRRACASVWRPTWTARLVLMLAVLALAAAAQAQGRPDLVAVASSSRVEVGEPFTVDLKALVDQSADPPSDPHLTPPPGFQVSGPRISTQTVAQFGGGRSSVKVGLGATWTLIAQTPGRFTIPAPTVAWGGSRLRAQSIEIDVAPSTGAPRRPSASPFLLPGGPFPGFPGFGGTPRRDWIGDLDDSDAADASELSLDYAPDDKVFLRTQLDKVRCVVGEQVTASFWIYYRADFELSERHDAPLADFIRVPLLKNPGTDAPVYAIAQGRRYAVRLLDRLALFPVRVGDLHTGQLTGRFTGRRIGARVLRQSNDAVVTVTHPPADGRPPGWSGAVGNYEVSATVAPRRAVQGGSVAVTVKVSGAGNVPSELNLPTREGIEWLDPERRDAIEPVGNVVKGWRSFGYVVRFRDAGPAQLGAITLPFWDPAAKSWQVASVELGGVEVDAVAPSEASSPADDAPANPFAALPMPRGALSAWVAPPPSRLQGARLWLLVAAPPLLCGLVLFGDRAARRLRTVRRTRAGSALSRSAEALRDATDAGEKGDAMAMAMAGERAIHHAIEAGLGLKSRAVLLADLAGELVRRGVAEDLAREARDTLAECDALRFAPGASPIALGELSARVRGVASALCKMRGAP